MQTFTPDLRLVVSYMELLISHLELREIVKIILILTHGNAHVESGFLINEDILIEDMSESSTVA